MFMCIEIMLNAINLLLVALSVWHNDAQGQVFVFFVMGVAAAEVVVGLTILVSIGFLIHVYSIGYMKEDEGFSRFFSYLNLFVFFMITLVLGNNLLVTFIGWEGVGLCSYLLIGFWYKNTKYNQAANKAFIMNRIVLQKDIKKILAYSTISQLGLMFLALGLGAYTTGSVIHALHHQQDIRKMGVFFTSHRGTEKQWKHAHESSAYITIPLIVLGILSIVGGAIGLPHFISKIHWLHNFLEPVFIAHKNSNLIETSVELKLMAFAIIGA
ncbi:unnamed protein product, partial [Darwinula stevensoni]